MSQSTLNSQRTSEWEEIGQLDKQNSKSHKKISKLTSKSPVLVEYEQLTSIIMKEYLKHIEFLSTFQQSNFRIFSNSISMWQNFLSSGYELNRKFFGIRFHPN